MKKLHLSNAGTPTAPNLRRGRSHENKFLTFKNHGKGESTTETRSDYNFPKSLLERGGRGLCFQKKPSFVRVGIDHKKTRREKIYIMKEKRKAVEKEPKRGPTRLIEEVRKDMNRGKTFSGFVTRVG